MSLRSTRSVVMAAVLLVVFAVAASASAGGRNDGAVYTLSNEAGGNAVLVFDRGHDGTLSPAGSVPTGGLGTGGGLGSQAALVLDDRGKTLFAVDAGSNEITVLEIGRNGPEVVSHVDSGGVMPISIAVDHDLVYVLNAGDATHAANITGFEVRHHDLEPIAGSTRPLSNPQPGPAQIQFTPDGDVLVVTEKGTDSIDTYVVGRDGLTGGPIVQPSAGATPFGFDFDKRGHLIVSDAFGGGANASALSSYNVAPYGAITTITPLAPNGQTAACWVVTTKDGRYAYTTNTGSANVSSYAVAHDGGITLLDAAAGLTGATPIDAAIADKGGFLYTLDAGGHDISAFAIGKDGSLTPVAGASGLPVGAVGLAAA